jgi:hypothetical protein
LVLHHHHTNGTKRQQLGKYRPQSSMPAPKRQRTRNGGNELTLSTDIATGVLNSSSEYRIVIFYAVDRGQGRAEEFQWRQSQRARLVGVLVVIGTEEHIPCDVRLPAWTPIHTKFSPLKAVRFQNRLAIDITAARLVTDTIPIAPGDVNAKLV